MSTLIAGSAFTLIHMRQSLANVGNGNLHCETTPAQTVKRAQFDGMVDIKSGLKFTTRKDVETYRKSEQDVAGTPYQLMSCSERTKDVRKRESQRMSRNQKSVS